MIKAIIGSGGHASVVHEIAQQNEIAFDFFVDNSVEEFMGLKKEKEYGNFEFYFFGIGGVTPNILQKRHALYKQYKQRGYSSFKLISKYSYLSEFSLVDDGVLIAHHAVVQTGARIEENVIINTGAIVEHDSIIEGGCHIAPGAIILGGAKISSCSIIGAGAVVLPYQIVPPNTLIPSLTRYKQ